MKAAEMSAEQLHVQISSVFERQAATALRLRRSTAAERIEKIRRLRDAVIAHAEDWYAAAHADFRKPSAEVDLAEIMPICLEANDAIRHLKSWMKPTRVRATMMVAGTKSWIKYEPRGRCLIISPWNYPVNLTFCPLISAIAAGNTAIIKPSEMTPNLSAVMARVVKEVFSEDEVALFEGEADVSQALLALPFDHMFFTGSPAIGKVVMAAAAKHLSSVTLELGGKSPTIVDETADINLAAQNILWAKFANAGQTCIAPDYVYVHESVKEAFLTRCRELVAEAYGATPEAQKSGSHMAHIVNARHRSRVQALLDDATAKGARVLTGGLVSQDDNYVAPTLLDNVDLGSRIMEEEIFGPLLPVLGFQQLDEVIAHVNAGPKPLALYLYTRSSANEEKVLQNTSSGGACINHALVHFMHARLPFGGVNNSGIGNSHGHFGFKTFSHERAVLKSRSPLVTKMLKPGAIPAFMQNFMRSAFRWL